MLTLALVVTTLVAAVFCAGAAVWCGMQAGDAQQARHDAGVAAEQARRAADEAAVPGVVVEPATEPVTLRDLLDAEGLRVVPGPVRDGRATARIERVRGDGGGGRHADGP